MEKKVRPAKSHLAGRFGRRASARYQRRLPVVVSKDVGSDGEHLKDQLEAGLT